jgi:type III pantothenate kinase
MASLVVDIGNTFTKLALFDGDELISVKQLASEDDEQIKQLISNLSAQKAILSSVKKERAQWQIMLAGKMPVVYFDRNMAYGVNNHYQTPQTLGLDRLAAVTGAVHLYPGKSSLVIDGGTCITYDYVDAGANYFGGSISPGLKMRYSALNYYTAALPVVETDAGFTAQSGNDTITSIRSGVQNGIRHELEGFINDYKKDGGALNVILTGGDGNFFDTLLKNSIFAPCIKIEPYLVLKGLNAAIQKQND